MIAVDLVVTGYWNTKPVLPPINGGNGFGLFYIGNNTPTTNKYIFSNSAVSLGTNLTYLRYYGNGAAGNASMAVINIANATSYTYSNIYTYSNDSVTNGTVFPSNIGSNGNATGNSINGYYQTNGYNYWTIYNYSANTTSLSSTASQGISSTATGTSTFGLFVNTMSSSEYQYSASTFYTYSTSVVTNGTNMFNNINSGENGGAAGNTEIGVFSIGQYYSNGWKVAHFPLNVYTYASNVVITTVTLSIAGGGPATGNNEFGFFSIYNNTNSVTNIYNYSNNTISNSTNLSNGVGNGAATSNYNPGVNT